MTTCAAEPPTAEIKRPSRSAPIFTLDDVARAYPTWRVRPTVGGCVAWAALVPSWTVHADTAPVLLAGIEASIQRRR